MKFIILSVIILLNACICSEKEKKPLISIEPQRNPNIKKPWILSYSPAEADEIKSAGANIVINGMDRER